MTVPQKNPRIAHCVGFFFPDGVGGTEVYVQDLYAALSRQSVDGYVIAATDRIYERYVWDGTPVLRYPSNWANIRDYAASSSRAGLSKFQELIVENAPDIFHLHSWTAGAGLRHLSQVHQLGIPCVVTMHVPSALCLRGTMLLNGSAACDGHIEEIRYAQCWTQSRGLPTPLAFALSRLPRMSFSGTGWAANVTWRGATMLSARSLVDNHARELQAMSELSERIVAPSQWVYDALAINGVPLEKLSISRQAVAQSLVDRGRAVPRAERGKGKALTIGFMGRLEPYKGAHLLLEAIKRIPRDVPIHLKVAGSGTEPEYLRSIETIANKDKRIEFPGPLEHDEISQFLRGLDVLAVPSNYMETGPLVVLEAYAFGIPVMGADIGGISERIRDGVDGWLLPFDDSGAWAAAIQDIALDEAKLARLAANILPSRTMDDAASEMGTLYREILGAKTRSSPNEPISGPGPA